MTKRQASLDSVIPVFATEISVFSLYKQTRSKTSGTKTIDMHSRRRRVAVSIVFSRTYWDALQNCKCWQRYDRGILYNSHFILFSIVCIFFFYFSALCFVLFFRPLSTQSILFPILVTFSSWYGWVGSKFVPLANPRTRPAWAGGLVSCLVRRGPYFSGSNFLGSFIQRLDTMLMIIALSGLSILAGQCFEYPSTTIRLISYLAATFGMPWKAQHKAKNIR